LECKVLLTIKRTNGAGKVINLGSGKLLAAALCDPLKGGV